MVFFGKRLRASFLQSFPLRFSRPFALSPRNGILPVGKSPCLGVASLKIHAHRERYLSKRRSKAAYAGSGAKRAYRGSGFCGSFCLLGARKSEILNARWENVNIEQRLLTIPLSKSGKPRHIPLSQAALAVIGKIPRKPGDILAFYQ